ncbi:unnamed protein product, partial [Laminaria digitata]
DGSAEISPGFHETAPRRGRRSSERAIVDLQHLPNLNFIRREHLYYYRNQLQTQQQQQQQQQLQPRNHHHHHYHHHQRQLRRRKAAKFLAAGRRRPHLEIVDILVADLLSF